MPKDIDTNGEKVGTESKSLIITNPVNFFAEKRRTLSERLDEVTLEAGQVDEITSKKGLEQTRNVLLDSFGLGRVVKVFLDWNEGVDKEIKEAKKSFLLEKFFEMSERADKGMSSLSRLVSDPVGSTIFNKIIGILDDSPPDAEQFAHLAAALKYVSETDYQRLFEEHRYAIGQIGRMTPQSLSILANHRSWPMVPLSSYSTEGTRVTSDYNAQFAAAFARSKEIENSGQVDRVMHAIGELQVAKLIEAHMRGDGAAQCVATSIGRVMLPYLANTYE